MIKNASIAFSAGIAITAGIALMKRAPAEVAEVEREKSGCERAIEKIDRKIAFHQKRFDRNGWWIDLEEVAYGHLSRAHLTGSIHDYAAAERALAGAFERADPGAGPFAARARLSFALHRFDRVEADLAASDSPLLGDAGRRAIAEMRADLLLHQGRYREAEAAYQAILASKRTITALARMAQYRWKTADFAAAEALLAEAVAMSPRSGEARAWLELQRGQMDLDRGRYAAARDRFEAADRAFDGWYLIEEHLAKALAGLGARARATAILQELADRTGNPEHVHELAALLEARGQFARAGELHEQANRLFAEQIARYPEAFSAHALEHMLGHVASKQTVEIAEANHRARPTAEALALLARAYLTAGRVDDAVRAVNEALATPISTVALHTTAAEVFAAAGDLDAAEREKKRAAAINPSASDELAQLRRR